MEQHRAIAGRALTNSSWPSGPQSIRAPTRTWLFPEQDTWAYARSHGVRASFTTSAPLQLLMRIPSGLVPWARNAVVLAPTLSEMDSRTHRSTRIPLWSSLQYVLLSKGCRDARIPAARSLDRRPRSIPPAAEMPLKIDNILQELRFFLDLDTNARFRFRLAKKAARAAATDERPIELVSPGLGNESTSRSSLVAHFIPATRPWIVAFQKP